MFSVKEIGESMRVFISKTAGDVKRAVGHPKYRYVLIGIGSIFFILVLLFGIIASINPQSAEEFYDKWRAIVENTDNLQWYEQEQKYDELWDNQAKADLSEEYDAGKSILGQTVQVAPATLQPQNREEDSVRRFRITVEEQTGGKREYMSTLKIKRKGIMRRWKIVGQEGITEPIPSTVAEATSVSSTISPNDRPGTQKNTKRTASWDTEFRIRQVLLAWVEAWEQEDLERYMDKYADYAKITRVTVKDGSDVSRKTLTKRELRTHMKRIFKKYDEIRVSIVERSLTIDETQLYAEAEVEFLQEYNAKWVQSGRRRAYSDKGLKHLQFMNEPTGGWKIYGEKWTKYEKVPKFDR